MESIRESIMREGEEAIASLPGQIASARECAKRILEAKEKNGKVVLGEKSKTPSPNEQVSRELAAVRGELEKAADSLIAVRRYVVCHIPSVEDGGNFGVDIQLAVVKEVTGSLEKLSKAYDELPDYFEKRASAWDKVMTKVSRESSKKSSKGESTGGEKGDMRTTSESESTEEKRSSVDVSPDAWLHLAALDVRAWGQLYRSASLAVDCLFAVGDAVEKNSEKLTNPRGREGGSGGGSEGGGSISSGSGGGKSNLRRKGSAESTKKSAIQQKREKLEVRTMLCLPSICCFFSALPII